MVGSNCSIYGCPNSRKKTKGLGIFQIPTKDDEYSKNWRNALVQITTKDMEVDDQLRELLAKRSFHNCQINYREDQSKLKFFIFNSDNQMDDVIDTLIRHQFVSIHTHRPYNRFNIHFE